MAEPRTRKPLDDPNTGIHRAKTWEIGLYALNNTSTNIYMFMFMYVSYFLTGIAGATVVFAGTITTVMRMWDGVTDPFIGYIVDKTNSKFGKNRPFIVIGNVILAISSFAIFKFIPIMPMAMRIPAYIVIYMLYIIGYTCQCVVTKSAQTCLTNDPKQRPNFAIFDSIYNTLLFALFPSLITGYLMPKHGGAAAFVDPAFFMDLWAICAGIAGVFAILAIIGIRRKDRVEYFGTGKVQKVGFKDYWEVIRKNKAIQMLVVSASSDKLASSMASNSIIYVMLFGIIIGDYAQYGLFSAMNSIPVVVVSLLLIKLVASRMGQKTAIVVGSLGSIICYTLVGILLRFGNPTSFDLSGATGITLFTALFMIFNIIGGSFKSMAGNIVIPMTADCADYEVYRSGKYVPGLMGTLFSFIDKMISSLAGTFVSLLVAAIGFTTVQPTTETPYSEGIFWVTIACFIGAPIFGWVCNLIAMKFYPLTKEKMAEIQAAIGEIKAKSLAEEA